MKNGKTRIALSLIKEHGVQIYSLILLICIGIILFKYRIDFIFQEKPFFVDTLLIIIFTIILMLPLFSEIEIFGLKFKKELKNIKNRAKEDNQDFFVIINDIAKKLNKAKQGIGGGIEYFSKDADMTDGSPSNQDTTFDQIMLDIKEKVDSLKDVTEERINFWENYEII